MRAVTVRLTRSGWWKELDTFGLTKQVVGILRNVLDAHVNECGNAPQISRSRFDEIVGRISAITIDDENLVFSFDPGSRNDVGKEQLGRLYLEKLET